MADATTFGNTTQILEPFRGIKRVTIEEYFTSGHRTCQGCESALVMKLMVKASGPRTIVLGSTGCMYVANTTYYTTPWVVPWMHTQLGSSGSAALGTAAGLKALMAKGKIKSEPINVIAFCGDGGGADMGLNGISATLTHTRLQLPHPALRQRVVRQHRHPAVRDDAVRRQHHVQPARQGPPHHPQALEEEHGRHDGGRPPGVPLRGHRVRVLRRRDDEQGPPGADDRRPDVHPLAGPVPEGLGLRSDAQPRARASWPSRPASSRSTRSRTAQLRYYGKTKAIVEGRPRKPVREYLLKQGRFAHFTEEDLAYFQAKVDETWDKWEVPGVVPFRRVDAARAAVDDK